MKQQETGFTLIEILISMTVLLVGLVGILHLFPVGINATAKAIEDTNAAQIAESAYAALKASVMQYTGPNFVYFHDGIASNKTFTLPATSAPTDVLYIPGPNYLTDFCHLGRGKSPSNADFNISPSWAASTSNEWTQWQQYSFNIDLQRTGNPKGLHDVTFRIKRGDRVIKKFYTQIFIPNTY